MENVETIKAMKHVDLVHEASKLNISVIGKKTEVLRSEIMTRLNKMSGTDEEEITPPSTAPVSKATEKVASTSKPKEPVKDEKTKAEKVETKKTEAKTDDTIKDSHTVQVTNAHLADVVELQTKKEKVICLHDLGYGPTAIGHAINLHPTNVCAILRNAGMSRCKTKVAQDVRDRISNTIRSKKK